MMQEKEIGTFGVCGRALGMYECSVNAFYVSLSS